MPVIFVWLLAAEAPVSAGVPPIRLSFNLNALCTVQPVRVGPARVLRISLTSGEVFFARNSANNQRLLGLGTAAEADE